MNTPVKLAAFLGGLALVFGAAFATGTTTTTNTTTDPDTRSADTGARNQQEGEHGTSAPEGGVAGTDGPGGGPAVLPGLAVSEHGYTLRPAATSLPAGRQVPFSFTVTGPDGRPLREYRMTHEKELHLIVVRRDLSGFQHVHPTRSADGTWSVSLNLPAAGTYRAFADFAPAGLGGQTLTLGADLFVPGAFMPGALPAPAATAVVDGYQVRLDTGTAAPRAGAESELTFTVSRAGPPVSDLQPYLGAFGHLVSLRGGDLAYLHTHPAQEARAGQTGGPQVRFATTFPTAGSYRLFLDFQHAGQVRTAAFTVEVPGAAGDQVPPPTATSSPSSGSHGH